MPESAVPKGCPLDRILKFFAPQWTAHIVWVLGQNGSLRFSELSRAMPGDISARVLSARLKHMEDLGLVGRVDAGVYPLNVSYSLSDEGEALHRLLLRIDQLADETPLPAALANLRDQAPE